jgi:hypothetical protein
MLSSIGHRVGMRSWFIFRYSICDRRVYLLCTAAMIMARNMESELPLNTLPASHDYAALGVPSASIFGASSASAGQVVGDL